MSLSDESSRRARSRVFFDILGAQNEPTLLLVPTVPIAGWVIIRGEALILLFENRDDAHQMVLMQGE
jgi:hypothetical protein